MATTYYLRNLTIGSSPYAVGARPDYVGAQGIKNNGYAYVASTTAGSGSTTNSYTDTLDSVTYIAIMANQNSSTGYGHSWVTPPLNAVTISGSISVVINGYETSMSANAAWGFEIYRLNAEGNYVSTIGTVTDGAGEMPSSRGDRTLSFTPGASVALNDGDRIGFRPYILNAGTMNSGYAVYLYHNNTTGNGTSYVTFTETLTEYTAPSGSTLYLTNTSSDISGSGNKEAWTSPDGGNTNTVTNTSNSPADPGNQLTASAGGTSLVWYSKKLSALTIAGRMKIDWYGYNSSTVPSTYPSIKIERTNSSGTVLSTVYSGALFMCMDYNTSKDYEWYPLPTSTVFNDTDRLKITLYIASDKGFGAQTSGYTSTVLYGTSSGVNITFTETLTEKGNVFAQAQAQAQIKAIAVKGYGQAQATIYSPVRGYGQAGATVIATHPRQMYQDVIFGTTGLVAYWRLGESSGTIAYDSKNGHNGSYTDANFTQGQSSAVGNDNTSYLANTKFNGAITVPDHDDLDLGDVFSIEFWIKRTTTATFEFIIDKGANTYAIYIDNVDTIRLTSGGSSVTQIIGATSWYGTDTTNWHHHVITKDGSTRKWYVDGSDVTSLGTNTTLSSSSTNLELFSTTYWSGADDCVSYLDEVALYKNYAMTSTDVANHYAARLLGTDTRPFGQAQAKITGGVTKAYAQAQTRIKSDAYGEIVIKDSPLAYYRMGARDVRGTFACGGECTLSHWTSVVGDVAVDSGTKYVGNYSIKITASPTGGYDHIGVLHTTGNCLATVAKFRIRFSSLPVANANLFEFISSDTMNGHLAYDQAAGKLCVAQEGGWANRVLGPTITTDTWYLIDIGCDVGTNGATIYWKVDGVSQTTHTGTGASGSTHTWRFGQHSTELVSETTYTMFVDDIKFAEDWIDQLPLPDDAFPTEEASASAAYDEMGNNSVLRYYNTMTSVNGLAYPGTDKAIQFDRASGHDLIRKTTTTMPAGSSAGVSIEGWINLASLGEDDSSYVIGSWAYQSSTDNFAFFAINSYSEGYPARYVYEWSDGTALRVAYEDYLGININERHHAAMVHNYTAETVKFYLDGTLVETVDVSAYATPSAIAANAPVAIGAYTGNDLINWDGVLDEVAFYNSVLTDNQIYAHWRAGSGGVFAQAQAKIKQVYPIKGYDAVIKATPNLKGYWRLNEPQTSNTAVDSSGNGKDGTYGGDAPTRGIPGALEEETQTATWFHRNFKDQTKSSKVVVPHSSYWDWGNGARTIELWFNRVHSYGYAYQYLISKGSWGQLGFDEDNTVLWDQDGSVSAWSTTKYGLGGDPSWPNWAPDNVVNGWSGWHHLVATHDPTAAQYHHIYVDGVDVTNTGTDSNNTFGNSTMDLYISRYYNDSETDEYDGAIHDLAVYDRALTLEEARGHYLAGVGGYLPYEQQVIADQPISYWRLGEPSGTTVVDEMGVNNGTYYGSYTLGQTGALTENTDTSVFFDQTTYGRAIVKANGPIISQLKTLSPARSASFTIEAWVKIDGWPAWDDAIYTERGSTGNDIVKLQVNWDTGHVQFVYRDDAGTVDWGPTSITDVTDNKWHHIVLTKWGTDANIYIDGIWEDQHTLTATDTLTNSSIKVRISGDEGDGSANFHGYIDEVAVYEYVLTPLQIKRHYQAATIKRTLPFAQAQATIKQINIKGFAQALAEIRDLYKIRVLGDSPIAYWRLNERPSASETYRETILSDSPVGYWRLDDTSGTLAVNKGLGDIENPDFRKSPYRPPGPTKYDGTYWGTTTLGVTGALDNSTNTAITLDNSTAFVEVPNSYELWTQTDFTIEAWFKTTSSGWGIIAAKKPDTGNTSGWYLALDDAAQFKFGVGEDTIQYTFTASSSGYRDGNWHHIVGKSYNMGSANYLQIWVDGNTLTSPLTTANMDCNAYATPLRIGFISDASTYFDGSIDEVAYYRGGLPEHRIVEHYKAGKYRILNSVSTNTVVSDSFTREDGYFSEIIADSPSAYWRLAEASSVFTDEIGTNDGTLYEESPGDVTRAVTGVIISANKAVKFDNLGNGFGIDIGDNAALDLGDTFTLECWVKRESTGATMELMHKGTGANSGYALWISSTDYIRVSDGAGTVITTSTGTFTDTTDSHHIVFVKSGSSRSLYLDGSDVTSNSTNITLSDNSSTLTLGANNAYSNRLDGVLDEVAIYKTALSPTRVLDHWNAGKGGWGAVSLNKSYGTWVHAYTDISVNPTRWTVDGSVAKYTLDATQSSGVIAESGISSSDAPVLYKDTVQIVKWRLDKLKTGGTDGLVSWFMSRMGNLAGGSWEWDWRNRGYYAGWGVSSAGAVDAILQWSNNSVHTTLESATGLGTYVPNDWWWAKFEHIGETLKLKVWKDGDTEPDWQVTATDSRFTTPGQVGIGTYTDTITNYPVVFSYDNYSVTAYDTLWARDTGSPTYGQTGALTGSTDTSISFNGTTDNLIINHSPILDLGTGNYSIEFWAKRTRTATDEELLDKSTQFDIGFNGSDKLKFEGYGTANYIATESGTTADTNWHHFVITRSAVGTGNTKIYKDGVDVTSEGPSIGENTYLNTSPMIIGDSQARNQKFAGLLDEIAIYKVVLTPIQVQDHWTLANSKAIVRSGQAQAKINAFNVRVFGQAQALLPSVGTFGQAQAQAKINAFNVRNYAQAQAQVRVTYRGFAQAQAQIKQTYFGYGQAQARIKQTYQGFAQAQTQIKATYRGFAQAQSQIKVAYQGFGQSQARIKQTYQGFAQAQAQIRQTYRGFGQAQAQIKQTYYGYAQAQAKIIIIARGYAQSQALIRATYQGFAQSQADIKQTYQVFAQAMGHVKATDVEGLAQAQALIRQTYSQYAQAQALVYIPVYYSPTADITNNGWVRTVRD